MFYHQKFNSLILKSNLSGLSDLSAPPGIAAIFFRQTFSGRKELYCLIFQTELFLLHEFIKRPLCLLLVSGELLIFEFGVVFPQFGFCEIIVKVKQGLLDIELDNISKTSGC